MTTLLQTHSLIHISLVLPSDTLLKPYSRPSTTNLFLPYLISKSPVSASLIFLQPSTPLITTSYSKDCLPGSVLLTLLSSGFNPIFLLVLFQLKHQKPHPNHALSPVVFRKVLFLGLSCSSSTLLHSAHSSKHPQLTITYTPTIPNYSSLSLQTVSPNQLITFF